MEGIGDSCVTVGNCVVRGELEYGFHPTVELM